VGKGERKRRETEAERLRSGKAGEKQSSLERTNRQLRRKFRQAGSFGSQKGAEVAIYLQIQRLHAHWSKQPWWEVCRSLSISVISTLSKGYTTQMVGLYTLLGTCLIIPANYRVLRSSKKWQLRCRQHKEQVHLRDLDNLHLHNLPLELPTQKTV
jgi:hypothetical protein